MKRQINKSIPRTDKDINKGKEMNRPGYYNSNYDCIS